MIKKVEYSSNNSGGSWWLSDNDWKALEDAGWTVDWYRDQKDGIFQSLKKNGRFLGALASRASREGLDLGDAIREWESVTGENSAALGCSCCGTPHSFTYTDDQGGYEYWSPEYPEEGDRYV